MRTRGEVEAQINQPGLTGPTIPNADRLMLELLLDIRDLFARDLLADSHNRKEGVVPVEYRNQ